MSYRYLKPEEAVPLLLDRTISPVVGFDTEYVEGIAPCRSPLRGVSMAGGKPGDFFGTFWHFGGGQDTVPWDYLFNEVILPLFRDSDRTLVAHPIKQDMQPLRYRGLRDEDIRCALRCTFSQAHIYNENLPKSLKMLAYALLGVRGVKSYKAVQKELNGLQKEGVKLVKTIKAASWVYYREWLATTKAGKPIKARKYGLPLTDPYPEGEKTGWHRLVDRLPTNGVKRVELMDYLTQRVEPVVTADYEERIRKRFGLYGTEDALYALAVDYFFQANIPPDRMDQVALETSICHPIVTEMEEHGLRIDVPLLGLFNEHMAVAAAELQQQVRDRWFPTIPEELHADFNPGSHDQLAHIFWNVWKLNPPPWAKHRGGGLKPKYARKKDGLCKTDKSILGFMVTRGGPHHRDIADVMELHRLEDMLSDRTRPLLALAQGDPEHRVHSSFWHVGAGTGRFSSSDPNVENIPRPATMPYVRIPAGAEPVKPPRGLTVVWRHQIIDGRKVKKADKKRWRVGSLRDVFIPAPGYLYVSVDLSQVENRLVAFESNDPTLLRVFRQWDCAACGQSGETVDPLHACPNCSSAEGRRDKTKPDQPALCEWRCLRCANGGEAPYPPPRACTHCGGRELVKAGFCLGRDIHAHTSVMVGFFERDGYEDGRQKAKAVNHAAAYGMGPETMARQYGMAKKECEVALVAWHARHPNVRGVMHAKVEQAIREVGFVEMFDGHIRRFHAARLLMNSGNFRSWEWDKILREGVNALAQGGAAVLVKQAMLDVRERALDTHNLRKLRLVNQVHDELLYEVPEEHAEEALPMVCDCMENNRLTRLLSVPILADGATGTTWGQAH